MILRYVFQPKSVHYKYRFQCPDSSNYDPAFYELQLESLESFAWNLVDNVVGNHGTGDHKLSDVCININSLHLSIMKISARHGSFFCDLTRPRSDTDGDQSFRWAGS